MARLTVTTWQTNVNKLWYTPRGLLVHAACLDAWVLQDEPCFIQQLQKHAERVQNLRCVDPKFAHMDLDCKLTDTMKKLGVLRQHITWQ